MIPVTVEGYTYKSISAAWREISPPGLPEVTVRWRLKHDWPPQWAFTVPAVDPVDRRKFGDVRRTMEALYNNEVE